MKAKFLKIMAVVAAAYAAILAIIYFQQDSLLFPAAGGQGALPPDQGIQAIKVKTGDGETLDTWYVAPAPGKPLVLMFHGNGGRGAVHLAIAENLHVAGYGFALATFRGYAPSTGLPSQDGLYADGLALFDDVKARCACVVILLGHSLGSGVAVHTAALREAKAMLLVSPYSSIEDIAASRYWYLPVSLLIRNTFPSTRWIGQVEEPMIVLHGDSDTVIPIEFGRKLYEAASQPRKFITFKGAGHGLMGSIDTADYVSKVLALAQASEAAP